MIYGLDCVYVSHSIFDEFLVSARDKDVAIFVVVALVSRVAPSMTE